MSSPMKKSRIKDMIKDLMVKEGITRKEALYRLRKEGV